jgi:hypothetical protein
MAIQAPFQAQRGANQVVTPGAASASVTVSVFPKSIRLVNSGANICHVRVGEGAQTATTADTPVLPNSELILHRQEGETTVAYISASGTTLHIQTGEGGI